MKLGGSLPPGQDALLFSRSGAGHLFSLMEGSSTITAPPCIGHPHGGGGQERGAHSHYILDTGLKMKILLKKTLVGRKSDCL